MANLTNRAPNAIAARGRTAVATRAGVDELTIKDTTTHPPGKAGEAKFYVLLVRMPFGIVDPTVPVVKAQSDTVAKFCQIMPYHDGTGLIIGCGIGSHLKYNENTHYHDEAKRLGLDILSWKGVVLPRPIARKVIEDASLHCYLLAGSTRDTAFVSYIHARNESQALKLWSLSKRGLPPQVLLSRCAALEVHHSTLQFVLGLPQLATYHELATTT